MVLWGGWWGSSGGTLLSEIGDMVHIHIRGECACNALIHYTQSTDQVQKEIIQ